MFKVSQSKVKRWRRCKQEYHYKYVDGLKRKHVKRPFAFGRLVHEMIEAEANGDDPFEYLNNLNIDQMKLFQAEREEYGDLVADVRTIMTAYFEYWEDRPLTPIRMKKRSAEHPFEIDIAPDILWRGYIDEIAITWTGLRALVEHKTFSKKPSEDERWRNLQSSVYARAVDMMGWKPIEAVCWDYIRSKPPTQPQILKDGSISVRKIDTLPSVVRAVLAELPHAFKYEEFLQQVEASQSDWFDRVISKLSRTTVDIIFDQFVESSIDMKENHGKKSEMNIERHCGWCEFEPLCRARLQNHDFDFVKEREYEKE
jgi:hypothetical protein